MLDRRRCLAAGALALILVLGGVSRALAQPAVPVRVVNPPPAAPAKQPFQREFFIEVPSGAFSASATFTVPVGKRLVIEFVGGTTRLSDWELVRLTLRTTAGGETAGHELAPTTYRRGFEGSDPAVNPDLVIGFSQLVRIYADPGTNVHLTFLRTENREISPAGLAASVSGFLVDCGPDPACPVP